MSQQKIQQNNIGLLLAIIFFIAVFFTAAAFSKQNSENQQLSQVEKEPESEKEKETAEVLPWQHQEPVADDPSANQEIQNQEQSPQKPDDFEMIEQVLTPKNQSNGEDSQFNFGQTETVEENVDTETQNKNAKIKPLIAKRKSKDSEKTPEQKVENQEKNESEITELSIDSPENFKNIAILQALDKITARTSKLEVKIGEPIKFGNLKISLHSCWKSPPQESPESKAFLEMWEEITGEPRKKVFYGWMFASTPFLSAPQHPIYDINVIECKGSSVAPKEPQNP